MLKINSLVSGYGTVQILNGANMEVKKQSIVALLGGNGTGKSTILKACSGIIRAWEGIINFDESGRIKNDYHIKGSLINLHAKFLQKTSNIDKGQTLEKTRPPLYRKNLSSTPLFDHSIFLFSKCHLKKK